MLKFIDQILSLVITMKSDEIYRDMQEHPDEAARSTYFGKKFIHCFFGGVFMAAIALVSAFGCYLLAQREVDIASFLLFFVYILCFASAAMFALYAVIFILTRLKYVRWQRKLSDLPIGRRVRIFSFFAVPIVIALSIAAVTVAILSLGVALD